MVRAKEEDLRNQVVNKGAPVQADKEQQEEPEKKEWTYMTLRIPTELVLRIKEIVKKDPPHSRTAWIINAVRKRLKEETE